MHSQAVQSKGAPVVFTCTDEDGNKVDVHLNLYDLLSAKEGQKTSAILPPGNSNISEDTYNKKLSDIFSRWENPEVLAKFSPGSVNVIVTDEEFDDTLFKQHYAKFLTETNKAHDLLPNTVLAIGQNRIKDDTFKAAMNEMSVYLNSLPTILEDKLAKWDGYNLTMIEGASLMGEFGNKQDARTKAATQQLTMVLEDIGQDRLPSLKWYDLTSGVLFASMDEEVLRNIEEHHETCTLALTPDCRLAMSGNATFQRKAHEEKHRLLAKHNIRTTVHEATLEGQHAETFNDFEAWGNNILQTKTNNSEPYVAKIWDMASVCKKWTEQWISLLSKKQPQEALDAARNETMAVLHSKYPGGIPQAVLQWAAGYMEKSAFEEASCKSSLARHIYKPITYSALPLSNSVGDAILMSTKGIHIPYKLEKNSEGAPKALRLDPEVTNTWMVVNGDSAQLEEAFSSVMAHYKALNDKLANEDSNGAFNTILDKDLVDQYQLYTELMITKYKALQALASTSQHPLAKELEEVGRESALNLLEGPMARAISAFEG